MKKFINYMLVFVSTLFINYNFIAFYLFKVTTFVDYFKLPYWLVNIDEYLNHIDDKTGHLIFENLAYFDLHTYGPLICLIICLIPFVLLLFKNKNFVDFSCLFLNVCLNLAFYVFICNDLFHEIGYLSSFDTYLSAAINWVFLCVTCFLLLVSTLVAWALSAKKLKE